MESALTVNPVYCSSEKGKLCAEGYYEIFNTKKIQFYNALVQIYDTA